MACSQHVCVHKYIKYLHNSSSVSGGQVYEMEPVLCNGVGVLFFENASATLLHSFPPDIHWVYITGKNEKRNFCYQRYYMQGNMPLDPGRCS